MDVKKGPDDELLEELAVVYRAALEEYTGQLRKTTELLVLAGEGAEGMRGFVEQQRKERAAFERFREVRRRYISTLKQRVGRAPKTPPSG